MTTKRPDLYAILGVLPSATPAEISHAYRTLLRRHHPDTRTSDDESHGVTSDATLQQVLAAYTVLRDPARRADYDRETAVRAQQAPRRQRQHPRNHYGVHVQVSIIAGPVRWHRS